MVDCFFGKCDSVFPALFCKSGIHELLCVKPFLIKFRAEELIAKRNDPHNKQLDRQVLKGFFGYVFLMQHIPVFIAAALDNYSLA